MRNHHLNCSHRLIENDLFSISSVVNRDRECLTPERVKNSINPNDYLFVRKCWTRAVQFLVSLERWLCCTAFLLFALISNAQNFGEIHGRLLDYTTKEALPYATISTEYAGQVIGTTTDEDGRFKLKSLNSGQYKIQINYLGYNTKTIVDIEVSPGKIYVLGEVLLSGNNELPPIEITAIKLIDVDEPNTLVIKAADIKHNANLKRPAQLIGSITSDLTTNEAGQFIVRGARPGASGTFIDGIKLRGALGNIPGSAIKTISIYTGGLPARYGDVTGGVVVIETKGYFDYYYEYQRD